MSRRQTKKEQYRPISDELKTLFNNRRAAEQRLSDIESLLESTLYNYAISSLDKAQISYNRQNSEIEVWQCHVCPDLRNSAYYCVYDTVNDPNGDECLFCGDPYERK